MTQTTDKEVFLFLKGPGEMAERTRQFDWSKTPLGHPGVWPAPLQTMVSVLLNSKFPMFLLWGDEYIQFYNDAYRPSFGTEGKHPQALGQRGRDCWQEAWSVLEPLLEQVRLGGEAVWKEDQPVPIFRNGRIETTYWTFSYSPVPDEKGGIGGVLSTCFETTEKVLGMEQLRESADELHFAEAARKEAEARLKTEIEESRRQLLYSFEESPVAVATIDRHELTFTMANSFYGELVGRQPKDIINKPLLEALPELRGQGFDRLLEGVLDTGIPYTAKEVAVDLLRKGTLERLYVDLVYQPQYDAHKKSMGILVVATDVTQQVRSRRVIEESEAKFRSLIDEAPVATCLFVGRDMKVELANNVMLSYWGKDSSIMGLPLAEAVPELAGQHFLDILDEVFTTGKAYSAQSSPAQLAINGKLDTYYFDFTYKPLRNIHGEVYAVMDMAVDVTKETMARQQIEAAETSLRSAIELAELATWSIDIPSQTIHYSKRLQEWLGVEDAVLQIDSSPRIHPKDQERVGHAMKKAMEPGGSGYFNEVYTIVHSLTGQQRIIHTNGIAKFDGNGQAISISGTSQDVTLQQELQMALANQVQQRTEELETLNESLRRSNDELSQYAYVASHDLQEPLRKIRIFSELLHNQIEQSDDSKRYVVKISDSAARMSQLIKDLLEFSSLVNGSPERAQVDLNDIIHDVEKDFELLIEEKQAVLTIDPLPVIPAVKLQMNQLFYNILSNALKFSKKDVAPQIDITCRKAQPEEVRHFLRKPGAGATYYMISIKDNGIGFEKKYTDQIFEVFKRLHAKDRYAGSGIGLALCRRIVLNHGGFMYAESEMGKGTTFHIIIPGA